MTKHKHNRLVKKYLKNVKKFEQSVKNMRIAMAKCRSIKKYLKELNMSEVSQEYRKNIVLEYQNATLKAKALNSEANALSLVIKDLISDLQSDANYEEVEQKTYNSNNSILNEVNAEIIFM